jgi:UDP:flavonoid glycosyltransferase YjiC (YdhE family)
LGTLLPTWFDTYKYATRVEWLGIGVFSSQKKAPHIDGSELSQALIKAITDEKITKRARELGELCSKKEGRLVASEAIAKLARESSS